MSNSKAYNPLQVSKELYQYLLSTSLKENDILHELRIETEALPKAMMLSDPMQVQFMTMMLSIAGAKKGIEVGVFTGYTSLAWAQMLPEDGKIIACDVSVEYTNIGKKYWEKAGVSSKIDLRIAPAVDTLQSLLSEEAETFDWVYIDADKGNYGNYYLLAKQLIRKGGLILIDNVLWGGKVIQDNQDQDTQAIRDLNDLISQDDSVEHVMLTVGDGLTIVRRK